MKPFIYIASLARTGSTLLSELLTEVPYAYIFHEPHIGKNFFALQKIDQEALREYGIDIRGFLKWRLPLAFLLRRLRFLGFPQDYMMRSFKKDLLPELHSVVSQVGVKEIRHTGWENYIRHFPDMRTIVTGRDPRDIYLSLSRLWEKGHLNWRAGRFRKKPFNPQTAAEELNREFRLQKKLITHSNHLLVRYEDLCQDPAVVRRVLAFADSPLPSAGSIGSYSGKHPKKLAESSLHGGRITSKQIFKWKSISDTRRLQELHDIAERMSGYRRFWNYA